MATKFTSLEVKKDKKKTQFYYVLSDKINTKKTDSSPCLWDNVLYIGYDSDYGDVFKCWDNGGDGFGIFFGEKGDEFN